jgi:hypothetical protein
MSNDDSYDEFDFTEFSQEDLLCIDHTVADACATSDSDVVKETAQEAAQETQTNGGPQLQVEVEEQPSDLTHSSRALQEVRENSPYALYRAKRNILSVTDLASPQW